MNKKTRSCFIISGTLFLLFALLIVAVLKIDVKPIGPENSSIGLATINKAVFDFFKVNMIWYHITDWISVVAIAVALGFAVLGLVQLIKRKSIKKVDIGILVLGAVYILTAACYVLFEFAVVNYRPIILGENLAPSFPSSTTLTVVVITGTAIIQFNRMFKQKKSLRIITITISSVILGITVIGRQISGVHWFTDILGALLLGSAIIVLYYAIVMLLEKRILS